ncbi:hypothetical protein QFZ52_000884 [Arthrobacter woluwensis]|uniref:hypothetical protein n=1 Tax=Arthrobacter woluwensis TaxID=156980 RepID=UPI002783A547|nr:hypothetical protein [Arthrobacter woluwensis]MDQ0708232.1 hypothetical protein [Arthrobacter woluwensis]
MKNARRALLALSAASLLAVTACSGPAQQSGGTNGGGGGQSAAPAAVKKYSEAELEGVLKAAKGADGKELKVLPSADLKKSLEASKELLAKTKISPAECGSGDIATALQSLDGASTAVGTSTGADGIPSQAVSLISGPDPSVLEGKIAQTKDQLEKCKTMTIEIAGQKAEATSEKVDASAKTPGAVAFETTTSLPGGATKMKQLTVMAVKNGVAITSVSLAGGAGAADVEKAVAALDAVADQIK